jgi:hypothetical protein
MAAAWTMLRAVLVEPGLVDRTAKEAVATAVAHGNGCWCCEELHLTVLESLNRKRVDSALATLADHRVRRITEWARSGEPARRPFPDAHAPELVGTVVVSHYLDRMATVLGDRSAALSANQVKRVAARASRTPRAGTVWLPAGELPPELAWARGRASVADAFGRAAAVLAGGTDGAFAGGGGRAAGTQASGGGSALVGDTFASRAAGTQAGAASAGDAGQTPASGAGGQAGTRAGGTGVASVTDAETSAGGAGEALAGGASGALAGSASAAFADSASAALTGGASAALAGSALAGCAAGVPGSVRDVVSARLAGWRGEAPADDEWLGAALAGLVGGEVAMGRLALLTAIAPRRVDRLLVDVVRERWGERALVELTSWAAFAAACRIGSWLGAGVAVMAGSADATVLPFRRPTARQQTVAGREQRQAEI